MNIKINSVEPVKRVNLTSQVMDTVKAYIANNNLTPGDKLPTERELTSSLGVSRNILREALKSLESIGLIEIKPGDGMYVSNFDYSSVVSHISFALLRNGQDLKHFIDARMVIELGALELAAENINSSDIAVLRESIEQLENASSIEEAAEEDIRFHLTLLQMSDNPVLSEFGSFLGRFFVEAQHLVDNGAKAPTAVGHKSLVTALSDRDIPLAKDILREHILSWNPKKDELNHKDNARTADA